MSFRAAVSGTPTVAGSYCTGLGALAPADKPKISCINTRLLTGSINVDAALCVSRPTESRWDYGIGYGSGKGERAIWVEVHPASSHHIEAMLNKLTWLKNWLRDEAPRLLSIDSGKYYWISTDGKIAITPNSPQARRLAAAGLRGPMRQLTLD